MNKLSEQVSVERVAAVLTALAPFALSTLSQFKTLDPIVQVAVVVVIGAAGCVWLNGRSRWTTVQQQINGPK